MSYSSGGYDPQATEEEASSRSQYVQWKDVRIISVALVVIFAGLYPVYLWGVRQGLSARCKNNFKAMFDAINAYATDHDNCLPPAYRTEGNSVQPGLGDSGRPYTWASDVQDGMGRMNFLCPAGKPEERSFSEDAHDIKKALPMNYGMYFPYGGFPIASIDTPNRTLILGETSNLGVLGSYDPLPFDKRGGKPVPDGFVIGWDNSNSAWSKQTNYVTRLAFGNDKPNTPPNDDSTSRHDKGDHFLTASGSLVTLDPRHAGKFNRYWTAPTPDMPK